MEFLTKLVSNLLTQPGYFVGLIVLIGMLVLKRPFHEALASFLKTAIGWFITVVGSGGLTSTFMPIVNAFGQKFGKTPALVDTYFLMSQYLNPEEGLYSFPSAALFTMISFIISFVWNFLLVALNKITRVRTLYITGHTLNGYSTLILWLFYLVVPGTQTLTFAILFGIFAGTWAAVGSNITFEATQNLTGGAGFGVGHQEMLGIWFTDKFAHLFGNPEKSVENIKLPGFLEIFKDNTISVAILMTVFFGSIMGIIGEEAMRAMDAGFSANTLFIVYILTKCLHFAVYMYILLAGVRMFIGELMKAFEGFSKKILKGSAPAVDCAVTYNFAHPNVPTIGFVFGFIGQLIAMAGLLLFKSPIFLVPGFVPLFFDNATLAVFANKKGGRNAAIIIPLLNGIFQVLVSLGMITWFQKVGNISLVAWPGFFDNNTWLPVSLFVNYYINPYFGTIILIVLLLLANQLYYRKHKEGYYAHVEVTEDQGA